MGRGPNNSSTNGSANNGQVQWQGHNQYQGQGHGSAQGQSYGSHTQDGSRSSRPIAYPPIDIKGLENQLSTLRVTLMQVEKRTEAVQSQMQELARTTAQRMERFAGAISRFEDNMTQGQQESTNKIAQVVAKVNERKVSDNKINELIDRHNHIIRNFENRLLALQRLASEQEMTLHNSQAALEEARNEIARLKR
jgi:chromosome segregation ATPase